MATAHCLLTPTEAALRLRRAPSTLRNWRWRGEGPDYVRHGGRVHYTEDALSRWLAAHVVSLGDSVPADLRRPA